MKRQIIALLTGAALLASPLMSQLATAQTAGSTATAQSKSSPKLNLTAAQKAQLKALRAETQAKIRAVLTPDQQAQFDGTRAAQKADWATRRANRGKGIATGKAPSRPNILQSLNLTAAQKAQIKQIRAAAKPKMDAVYTDAQKDQLAKIKADRKARKATKPKV
jgi:periplasmic protein CpxP/Spy